MSWLNTLLIALLVISSIAVIILVLLQHGKGADMGAAFGGGSSGSLFGATGSANFLSRATAMAATVFFLATLGLSWNATVDRAPSGAPAGIMGTMKQGAPLQESTPIPTAPRPLPAPAAPAAPPAGKAGEIPTQ